VHGLKRYRPLGCVCTDFSTRELIFLTNMEITDGRWGQLMFDGTVH
jgi:hypothetical protein